MTTSRSSRWAQWTLSLALFLVGCVLAFIVIKGAQEAYRYEGDLTKYQQRATVRVNGQELPVEFLNEVRGPATLTIDDFALQVSVGLSQHARATGTESCASVCRAENGSWGAAPITIGSHVACPVTRHCPSGTEPVGETIHSHPEDEPYVINQADMIVLGGCCRRVGQRSRAHASAEEFSLEDFAGGPGYMVTFDGKLFHQAGRNRVRRISAMPE